MSVLVYIENTDGKIKKTSLEAVCYAAKLGGDVTAISIGNMDSSELEKVINYNNNKLTINHQQN